jgi:dienelactone hydrolase
MSVAKPSLFSILVGFLGVGCNVEGVAMDSLHSSDGPTIHFVNDDAEVTRAFLPDPIHVRLTGFPPASRVTLEASIPGYTSHASFRVDDDGSVDVASQAPLDGTYTGAEADGLFWSMAATNPDGAPIGDDIDVTMRAEVLGHVVASATLTRYVSAPGVVETKVRDDGLVGVLVTPREPGPHPALLAFGGSEGGIDWGRKTARLYASLGYTCLGLAYFGAPGLPRHLEDLPLEYFGRALSWLKRRPEVKADAIGVIGASRGGELALLLGATFSDIKAVVAHVPSGVRWPGDNPNDPYSDTGSWTLHGHELSYVHPTDEPPVYVTDAKGHSIEHDTPMFDAALDATSASALDKATTRVERVHGPVLMLASADDQIWPSCRLASVAMDRLTKTGHADSFEDDLVCYPDAGHILGTPGLPTTGLSVLPSKQHAWIALGGTPSGAARAGRDAFDRKRAFLEKALER